MPQNTCEHFRTQFSFFLDGELEDRERSDLEAHLEACTECSAVHEAERDFRLHIRKLGPLYEAPENLRTRVAELVANEGTTSAPSAGFRDQIARTLGRPFNAVERFAGGRRLLTAALVLLAAALFLYVNSSRRFSSLSQQSAFAKLAEESHERRIRGQLPLEISSGSPKEISDWFAGKVSFSFQLPNYQESSGQERLYELEGARLVALENDYAACVAYRMRQRPITLVVTSNEIAMPSGGEEISFKGLNFHYHSIRGFKVITWADRGLTYALVSDFEERGQQSCIVCHTGSRDREMIEALRPRV